MGGPHDEFWGEGASVDEQLATFDAFWISADTLFAAFGSLPSLDWDALRDQYRPEIERGVSRGRLAGIMGHLALALREGHTYARDTVVSQTDAVPGVPLLYGWSAQAERFGACDEIAGNGVMFLYVPDLAAERSRLQGLGIALRDDIPGAFSTLAQLHDLDGDLINLASIPDRPFPAA